MAAGAWLSEGFIHCRCRWGPGVQLGGSIAIDCVWD